jgi:hypothetical protein
MSRDKNYRYIPPRLPSAIDLAVKRYALLSPEGKPIRCGPDHKERYGHTPRKGPMSLRVIYPSLETAERAAQALTAIDGKPQYAYLCGRRNHGHHYHLTSKQQLIKEQSDST